MELDDIVRDSRGRISYRPLRSNETIRTSDQYLKEYDRPRLTVWGYIESVFINRRISSSCGGRTLRRRIRKVPGSPYLRWRDRNELITESDVAVRAYRMGPYKGRVVVQDSPAHTHMLRSAGRDDVYTRDHGIISIAIDGCTYLEGWATRIEGLETTEGLELESQTNLGGAAALGLAGFALWTILTRK